MSDDLKNMNLSRVGGWLRLAMAAVVLAVLAGCATGPGKNPRDPLEPFNRDMSRFNDTVDSAVFKPVATAYREVTPSLVRTGVNNFFSNLGEVWSFVNNVLQLDLKGSADTALRFGFNTIFGLGGTLDIASEMQIEQHKQDFGQTLARYGVPTGPYIVLPILGPSTLRDTVAEGLDPERTVRKLSRVLRTHFHRIREALPRLLKAHRVVGHLPTLQVLNRRDRVARQHIEVNRTGLIIRDGILQVERWTVPEVGLAQNRRAPR